MYETRLCYKILPAANLGYDTETGQPCEVYCQIKIDHGKQPSTELVAEMHTNAASGLAEQLEIEPSLVEPISVEEYDANTEEE